MGATNVTRKNFTESEGRTSSAFYGFPHKNSIISLYNDDQILLLYYGKYFRYPQDLALKWPGGPQGFLSHTTIVGAVFQWHHGIKTREIFSSSSVV